MRSRDAVAILPDRARGAAADGPAAYLWPTLALGAAGAAVALWLKYRSGESGLRQRTRERLSAESPRPATGHSNGVAAP